MPRAGAAEILALGFGTSVAMWGLGFIGRAPGNPTPSWALFVGLLACLATGGGVAGRYGQRGVRGGVYVGLLAGALNLLILGSLLAGDQPNRLRAAALWALPGSVLVSAALAGLGAALGSRSRGPISSPPNWRATFAFVAAAATLLLLAVGGSVTGFDYGLAVVDWPNTEGYNMFLYPLARMTGGIYYEHSHRLMGSLVGLTTLALTLYLQATESRRWLKLLAWLALLMVMAQGVLGGLRVTGHFTLSTVPADTSPNIVLAIIHGIVGQVFLGLLVAIGVCLTTVWINGRHTLAAPGARVERALGVLLVVLLLVQLAFGALVRHLTPALQRCRYGLSATPEELAARGTWALHLHITLAVVVTVVTLAAGARLWGLYPRSRPLRRLGIGLMILVGVQVVLGVAALVVTANDSAQQPPTAGDVLISTAHQVVGAGLLATAVAAVVCSSRLVGPASKPAPAA